MWWVQCMREGRAAKGSSRSTAGAFGAPVVECQTMAEIPSNNWTTELRKGLWAFCVLKAVAAEPCYGYDIVRRLSEIKGLFVDEATVYRALHKLRKLRLVSAAERKSPIGPPRKYYRITRRGRDELARRQHFWRLIRDGVEAVERGRGRPGQHRDRA